MWPSSRFGLAMAALYNWGSNRDCWEESTNTAARAGFCKLRTVMSLPKIQPENEPRNLKKTFEYQLWKELI